MLRSFIQLDRYKGLVPFIGTYRKIVFHWRCGVERPQDKWDSGPHSALCTVLSNICCGVYNDLL